MCRDRGTLCGSTTMSRSAAVWALSALVAAIPILVLFFMLGVLRKPAWMAASSALGCRAASSRSRSTACRCSWPSISTLYGAAFGIFPIAWIVFTLDPALPAGGRHRQVRDHQGLGRRPHERPPAAGDVHRLLVRRVHRRRGRIRRAGGRLGRDARRPRLLAVLRRRHLPARQHRAGRVRVDRHSRDHPRERDRPAGAAAERDGRPAVRDDFDRHPGLPGRRDGGAEARARSAAGHRGVRRVVRGRCSSTCRTSWDRS